MQAHSRLLAERQPDHGLEALRLFGCMRLASRISDLRKSHPEIKFKSTRVETTTGKKVAQYYIESIQ